MTLSDTRTQSFLHKHFVSAWVNTEGDEAAGSSFAHAPSDGAGSCIRGNGRSNLQILALTPDGRILHAITGYIGSADLRSELDWALETYALMKKTPTLESAMVEERARDHAQAGPKPTHGLPESLIDRIPSEHLAEIERGLVERAKSDSVFVAEHPLMPIASFRTAMLTGGGASFFGSTSGAPSGGTIGNTTGPRGLPPKEVLEMIEELRERAEGATPTGDS